MNSSSSSEILFKSLVETEKDHIRDAYDICVLAIHAELTSKKYICSGKDSKHTIVNTATHLPVPWNDSDTEYTFEYKLEPNTIISVNIVRFDGILMAYISYSKPDNNIISSSFNVQQCFQSDVTDEKNIDNLINNFNHEQFSVLYDAKIYKQMKSDTKKISSSSSSTNSLLIDRRGQQQPRRSNNPYDPYYNPSPSFGQGDLNPFGNNTGNLMGPNNFQDIYGRGPNNNPNMRMPPGRGRGGIRFDPYGPPPNGMYSGPDNDMFQPPGPFNRGPFM